jgi:hypothetical protein
MSGLRRYIEWMSRGRRTDRIAYVMKEWDLPVPLPGAEWQRREHRSSGYEAVLSLYLLMRSQWLREISFANLANPLETDWAFFNL